MEITYNLLSTTNLSLEDSGMLTGYLEQLAGISSKGGFGLPDYRDIRPDDSDCSFIVVDTLNGDESGCRRIESIRKYSINPEGKLVEKGLIED